MAFEGIDIEITGSAGDAKAAIRSTKASLNSLSRSANDAQDSVEEVGDAASRATGGLAGFSAAASSGALSLFGLSAGGTAATGSFLSLTGSITGVTAAIIGLSTVLAPVAATLVTVTTAATGLATAFGAVVGSGIIAFGDQRAEQNREQLERVNERIVELRRLEERFGSLTAAQERELEQLKEKRDRLEETTSITGALADVVGDLREEIAPLIIQLGDAFVPLIEDTVNALPSLVESVIGALGPLDEFRATLRSLGRSALRAIPQAVAALVDFGRRALPFFRSLINVVGSGAAGAFAGMARVTERVGDDLLQIAGAIGRLLPELTETGTIIIEAVTPAVVGLIDGLRTLFRRFNAFVNSQAGAEIFAEIRREILPLIPRVRQLGAQFRPVLDTLIDELPEIIRGTAAFGETVIVAANIVQTVLVPVLSLAIEALGEVVDEYAEFLDILELRKQQITGAISQIRSAFEGLKDFLNNVFSLDGLKSEIEDAREKLAGLLDELRRVEIGDIGGESPGPDPSPPDPGPGGGGGGDGGGGGGGRPPAGDRDPGPGAGPGGALASGGIVTEPMNALLAEGSEHEAVMPLSRLEEFVNRGDGVRIEEINVHASGRREGREAGRALKRELTSQF